MRQIKDAPFGVRFFLLRRPAAGYGLSATTQLRTDLEVGRQLGQPPALGYGVGGATRRLSPILVSSP